MSETPAFKQLPRAEARAAFQRFLQRELNDVKIRSLTWFDLSAWREHEQVPEYDDEKCGCPFQRELVRRFESAQIAQKASLDL